MLASETARTIAAQISAGAFRPGAKLNEVALSAEYRVSRNTLREAFVMLAHEGVVERFPNRGVFIARPGKAQVLDIYRARLALEPAALCSGINLAPAELLEQVELGRGALIAGDDAGVALANQRFHQLVVAAHGSPTLDELMERLLARMRLVFLEVQEHLPSFHEAYIAENAAVVELVGVGKRDEAADLLARQLAATATRITALL